MKKLIALIAMAMMLLGSAMAEPEAKLMRIIDIDLKDMVYVEDSSGDIWCFSGAEDFFIGDYTVGVFDGDRMLNCTYERPDLFGCGFRTDGAETMEQAKERWAETKTCPEVDATPFEYDVTGSLLMVTADGLVDCCGRRYNGGDEYTEGTLVTAVVDGSGVVSCQAENLGWFMERKPVTKRRLRKVVAQDMRTLKVTWFENIK